MDRCLELGSSAVLVVFTRFSWRVTFTTRDPSDSTIKLPFSPAYHPRHLLSRFSTGTNNSPTMAASQFTLKDVLEVPLLCFEAAADANPPFRLAYAILEDTNNLIFPCYRIWSNKDLPYTIPTPSHLSTLTFPPETLAAQLPRWNMCESFAYLLENEVDRLINNAFGANAEWMVTEPQPACAMMRATLEDGPMVPSHSVIKITEKDGKEWVMDGTCEQFNWPHDTWLMDYKTFVAARVRDGLIRRAEPAYKDAFRESISWFWEEARTRMEELFDELDYGFLFTMPRHERVQSVRAQAKAKFVGTWEEACEMADFQVDGHD